MTEIGRNQEDMPVLDNYEQGAEWSSLIFQTIFELEKKYKRFLRRKEVVLLKQTEQDRIKVSEAYLYLQEIKKVLVDAALYEDFIDMNDLRELSHLEELLHPKNRVESFTNFVIKLCKPIVFTAERKTMAINIDFIEGVDDSFLALKKEELSLFLQKYEPFISLLDSKFLGKGEIMNIEKIILDKLVNNRIKKKELEKILSPLDAEILSKLVSEKKIFVRQHENGVLEFYDEDPKSDRESASSSILLSPLKKE